MKSLEQWDCNEINIILSISELNTRSSKKSTSLLKNHQNYIELMINSLTEILFQKNAVLE